MTDIPNPPPRVHPTPAGMAKSLKNPKVLIAVAVLAVGFVIYFRHKGPSMQAVDGTNAPVGPDPYNAADLNGTQGATGVSGGSGDYGGFDSPTMNTPDWLLNPPSWVLDGPTPSGSEPASSNAANPVTVLSPGQSVYDAATHTLVTGGGPPNPPKHTTPPKAKPTPGKAAPKVNHSTNVHHDKRYVVRKRHMPGHSKGKMHTYHDYESAYGKGDWGKGGSVDMGPA